MMAKLSTASFIRQSLIIMLLVSLLPIFGQTPPLAQITEHPTPPPARDPHTPGYVSAKELPDGSVPPANVDGNFIIGPTYNTAPEISGTPNSLPNGSVIEFTMNSSDSKIYPGIARD